MLLLVSPYLYTRYRILDTRYRILGAEVDNVLQYPLEIRPGVPIHISEFQTTDTAVSPRFSLTAMVAPRGTPLSSRVANGFSISRCIRRRNGRAP